MAPDLGKKQNQANENGASSRPAGPKSVYVKPKEVLFPMDRVNKVVEVLYDGERADSLWQSSTTCMPAEPTGKRQSLSAGTVRPMSRSDFPALGSSRHGFSFRKNSPQRYDS